MQIIERLSDESLFFVKFNFYICIQKKSGRFTYLYAIKSYRTEDGKSTTKVVEKFGTVEELQESLGGEDPVKWAEERVAEMNAREKEDKEEIVVKLKPGVLVGKGEQRNYNGGYLFLQKIYYELGLDYVCKKIEKKHRNRFDLNGILSRLLYTRLLYPVLRAAVGGHTSGVPGPEPACHRVQ